MFKKIMATFCTLVFSAMLAGCGTQMGEDISSDISSMMPNTSNNSSTQNNNGSSSYQSNNGSSNQGNNGSLNQGNNNSSNYNASDAKITKEKAKEIALKQANLKETDITDYEIDLDNEDGKLVYEISFESNGKEYDYDVDANTGSISNSKNELVD